VASGLRTLLFSGLRAREVFGLPWADVDADARSIHLRKTKSGKARRVYLSSAAWAEIERMRGLRRGEHAFVFPGRAPNTPVMQPHHAFRVILKEAGISDFRIHDLRHTFASHMAQSGASILEIQKSLGHASSAMSERYSHLDDVALRARAEQAAQHITGTNS
jgi:integrase